MAPVPDSRASEQVTPNEPPPNGPLADGEVEARVLEHAPPTVAAIVARLREHGHGAYVVGGSLRDVLLGRPAADWDLTTDARPERILELFPGAVYENAFGTVAIRVDGDVFEVTTFRFDHEYADFRRPHHVEFGDSIEVDLARRDFTVNAMAWGWAAGAEGQPGLVDPFDGRADLAARRLRAVGDPGTRFREDALRMIRAARLAATLEFEVEPATLQAIREHAPLVHHLSGERIGAELTRLLGAPRPSMGLELMAATGLLDAISPELAAQRGIPQNKIPGDDLWAHTLRSIDAVPPGRLIVRLAALLHDIGKPATMADGRFIDHDSVGADQADALLRRLRYPRDAATRVVHLVRHHMFSLDPGASDAAVRRFIIRVGVDTLEDLFLLREADDAGSGRDPGAGIRELRTRVAAELAERGALSRHDLAVTGHDLMRELGLRPGPALGRILEALLDRVIADPSLNERDRLLAIARGIAGKA
jgi:tRNA nucleotidyltransferase (CCA-adding enzyme)